MNVEETSAVVLHTAFKIYHEIGAGLLENVYESILEQCLSRDGRLVERQKPLSFEYAGLQFNDAHRIDLVVERCLIVELKSVETLAPVYAKQLLTYLRLSRLNVGLLINFGAPTFKQAVTRIVSDHQDLRSSRLRVNRGVPQSITASARLRSCKP